MGNSAVNMKCEEEERSQKRPRFIQREGGRNKKIIFHYWREVLWKGTIGGC